MVLCRRRSGPQWAMSLCQAIRMMHLVRVAADRPVPKRPCQSGFTYPTISYSFTGPQCPLAIYIYSNSLSGISICVESIFSLYLATDGGAAHRSADSNRANAFDTLEPPTFLFPAFE